MYFGEYERTVDHKGRLTMPSHLLVAESETDWSKVMVLKGDLRALFLYDLRTWNSVMDEAYHSMDDDESRLFMHRTLSDAYLSDVDNLKRITVPSALLQHAGIDRRAMIVGMFNRLELWDPAAWSRHLETLEDVTVPSLADLSRARIREVS